jgi:hypothetical protein
MPSLTEQLKLIKVLRDSSVSASDTLYSEKLELSDIETKLRSSGTVDREMLAKKESLKTRLVTSAENLNTSTGNLHDAINALYENTHPRDLLKELNDENPFLLFPIRIETRFTNTNGSDELLIRVYPDDIAIHSHERLITSQEIAEGKKYWLSIFAATKKNGDEKEQYIKSAWATLSSMFGANRAAWVQRSMKPLNWKEAVAGSDVSKLDFPKHDGNKPSSWTLAPRTNILPDRFTFLLYNGETVIEQQGLVIPDQLFVGPDPLDAENAFVTKDSKLIPGPSYDWMSDFDKAVSVGMGIRIRLSPEQARSGFDKLLVVGLNLSSDERESGKLLESLIENHHYSSKGFSFIRQGTPTNNTEDENAGSIATDGAGYDEYDEEDSGLPEGGDARNLADAFGISAELFEHVPSGDLTDHLEAVEMNRALYPATLGYYFSNMLHPVVNGNIQDELRKFFTDHVSGRGPLPAILVGKQPYGILLTSDFENFTWNTRDTSYSHAFVNGLIAVLKRYSGHWKRALPNVAHIGKPGSDPSELLMDIMGLHPGSVSFDQRVAYSTDDLRNRDQFKYGGRYYDDVRNNFTSKELLLRFFREFGFVELDETGTVRIPPLLRLVFQHYHSKLDASNLIEAGPVSETEIVRYYNESVSKNYLHWLSEVSSETALESQDFGSGIAAPTSVLYLQLRRALLLQLHKASAGWLNRHEIDLTYTTATKSFYNIRSEAYPTKWEVMKTPVKTAIANFENEKLSVASYLLGEGHREDESRMLQEVKDSIKFLADVPSARLERCFTEHLDCCTYRLDAWQTALFNLRLQEQRTTRVDNEIRRRTGIYLGSFGWVENLRPSQKRAVPRNEVPEKLQAGTSSSVYEYTNNGGFVHAPSINQASAAALLRSGYLSHATSANPEVMSVNLSSARIRRALAILDGIRNGQPLEALLGYQFERGLHDQASARNELAPLNLFIYDFRDAYPFRQHQVHQQGTGGTTESIPANNVVNGVTLAEVSNSFPFGAKGDVLSATPAQIAAITEEKNRLSDTLDAVKDLLLSESVYQLVQGNFQRAGAVVNALKDSNIPPELDIINTPRSTHLAFTNRVTIQFENLDTSNVSANPWAPIAMTPRALMEPGMNKWIGKLIGAATTLNFRVSHLDEQEAESGFKVYTLDALKLQPVDLVFIVGNELDTGRGKPGTNASTGTSELEMRVANLYRHEHTLPNDARIRIDFLKPKEAGKTNLGTLLPMLRSIKGLITDSRYLHAQDFVGADTPATSANPKGFNNSVLAAKIDSAITSYNTCISDIEAVKIDATITDGSGVITVCNDLKQMFNALKDEGINVADSDFDLKDADAGQLLLAISACSLFGIQDAWPRLSLAVKDDEKTLLVDQAFGVWRNMSGIKIKALAYAGSASTLAGEAQTLKLIDIGKLIFGDAFTIIPHFNYGNEAEVLKGAADTSQLLDYAKTTLQIHEPVDEWLQNVSHVRPRLERLESIRMLYEISNSDSIALTPIQLPYRPKDSWIAMEFPKNDPVNPSEPFNIKNDTLSITIHGNSAFAAGALQSGLLVDDWTEQVPTNEEMSGISFNYDQPNAVAPQVLLLAVPSAKRGHWNWDDLVNILNDTLLRAKLRAVEPALLDQLEEPELAVLLPALIANFSKYDLDFSLDYRMNVEYVAQQYTSMMSAKINS